MRRSGDDAHALSGEVDVDRLGDSAGLRHHEAGGKPQVGPREAVGQPAFRRHRQAAR